MQKCPNSITKSTIPEIWTQQIEIRKPSSEITEPLVFRNSPGNSKWDCARKLGQGGPRPDGKGHKSCQLPRPTSAWASKGLRYLQEVCGQRVVHMHAVPRTNKTPWLVALPARPCSNRRSRRVAVVVTLWNLCMKQAYVATFWLPWSQFVDS